MDKSLPLPSILLPYLHENLVTITQEAQAIYRMSSEDASIIQVIKQELSRIPELYYMSNIYISSSGLPTLFAAWYIDAFD